MRQTLAGGKKRAHAALRPPSAQLSLKDINKASDKAWAEIKKLCEQAQHANVLKEQLWELREELKTETARAKHYREEADRAEHDALDAQLAALDKEDRALVQMKHYRMLQDVIKRREDAQDARDVKWRRSHVLACRALWERDNARAREKNTVALYERTKGERDGAVADLRKVRSYPTTYMKTQLEACVARNATLEARVTALEAQLQDAVREGQAHAAAKTAALRELADLRAGAAKKENGDAAGGGAAAGAKRARYGSLDEDALFAMAAENAAATAALDA